MKQILPFFFLQLAIKIQYHKMAAELGMYILPVTKHTSYSWSSLLNQGKGKAIPVTGRDGP
jgi:hypothetical protein